MNAVCCPLSAAELIPFDKEMKFEIGDTDYNTLRGELEQQSGQWGEG